MRPPIWNPPKELSSAEERVAQRIRKAKLFLFLRQIRHQLFDEEFQKELSRVFKDSTVGLCPVPPAQMALAILLQAYTGVSDDKAIEAMVMDRRWQLVLDCLDAETTPFGKGTLVRFRAALLAKNLDRSLIEKTVKMAEQLGGYPSRSLRVALDSSLLWGAARVEDIATAKAVRMQGVRQTRSHLLRNQTDRAVYEFDFLAKTNIVQFCLNLESTAVNITPYILHFELIPESDRLYEMWYYPSLSLVL